MKTWRQLIALLNWRHLRHQWLRTLLSLAGVIVGVSSFIFAPTLAATIHESTNLTTTDLGGRAELEIRSENKGVDVNALPTIRSVPGVRIAAPFSTGGGLLLGQSELLIFFGIDPAIDREVRTYQLVQGEFLGKDGQVLLSEPYAREKHIIIGDTVRLVNSGGLRTLTVVGTLSAENGVARLNRGDVVVLGLADALALRGANQVDTISILSTPETNVADLTAALQKLALHKVVVGPPSGRNAAGATFGFVLDAMISAVSLLILAIGSLLIYNTMAVSIAQRRSEIGVLRAMGATRSQIRTLFMAEAGILGFIGSVLGVGLGFLMVRLGSDLPVIPQVMISSSNVTSHAPIAVPAILPPLALLFGTIIPLLAGYLPSRAAANIDPVEAMIQIRAESGTLSIRWWRVIAAAVIVIAMLAIRLVPIGNVPLLVVLSNLGVFLSFAAMILILPPFIIALYARLPGWMHRAFGMVGMLAAGNVTRRPKRTMTTAMLMMMGIGMGVLISQSNFGYSDYLNEWNRAENVGELIVVGAGRDPFSPLLSVPARIVDEIKARPDVAAVVAERDTSLRQANIPFAIRAVDMAAFRAQNGRFMWNRGDETTAYDRLQDTAHPSVLVGTSVTALSNDYEAGRQLTLDTPHGPVAFDIVGTILAGVSTDNTTVVMDRALYRQLWQDEDIGRLTIKLKPSADAQAVRRDLLRGYTLSGVITLDSAELRAAFAGQIASIPTVSRLLSSLFFLIIAAGLGSTLLVAVIDRRREIGMLRSVGMLRRQMTRGIVLEALLLMIIGSIVGVPGAYLMTLMQQMAMQQIMGLRFSLNANEVVITVLLLTAISIVAAYFPARQAGRLNVLEAMRYE